MDTLSQVIVNLIFIPFIFLLAIAFAWVPMLAWNNSLHQIFPQIPAINYWQAFWLCILSGYIVHRPNVEIKK